MERAGRFAANTARTGVGLRAGNRTGLGDCPSKGRCLNQTTGERNPSRRVQTTSSGNVRPPGRTIPEREKEITALTHAPCPTGRAAAMPIEYSARMHTDQNLAPCFNLR